LVANQGIDRGAASVTEIDVATGVPVRVLSQANYGFDAPQALVVNGQDVFVANYAGASVTEFPLS
jgi:hypothetical protein